MIALVGWIRCLPLESLHYDGTPRSEGFWRLNGWGVAGLIRTDASLDGADEGPRLRRLELAELVCWVQRGVLFCFGCSVPFLFLKWNQKGSPSWVPGRTKDLGVIQVFSHTGTANGLDCLTIGSMHFVCMLCQARHVPHLCLVRFWEAQSAAHGLLLFFLSPFDFYQSLNKKYSLRLNRSCSKQAQ